jgi:hypothetical protein
MLRGAVPIGDACEAVDVHETNFRKLLKRDSEFRSEVTRARARGKAALVVQIAKDRDWRAKAWLLSRLYPSQFADTEPRRLPEDEKEPQRGPMVAFLVRSPDGKVRPISIAELSKTYANFPVVEAPATEQPSTQEPSRAEDYRFNRRTGGSVRVEFGDDEP